MVKHNFLIIFILIATALSAQKISLPLQNILATKNKIEYYEDTANLFTGRFAPLEVRSFKVEIKRVSIDKKRKKLFVLGYVSDYHSQNWKMGGVAIFKAKRSGHKLSRKVEIGETSFSRVDTEEDEEGFFDLVFDFKKGDRSYFYRPFFNVVEFNISKLLN